MPALWHEPGLKQPCETQHGWKSDVCAHIFRQDVQTRDGARCSLVHQSHHHHHPEIDVSHATTPAITIYSSAICPYCVMAKNFFKSKGLDWTEIRIDMDSEARERMVARTRRTSVPQIFVGESHVGGYDDLMALHRAGKFEPLLAGDGA